MKSRWFAVVAIVFAAAIGAQLLLISLQWIGPGAAGTALAAGMPASAPEVTQVEPASAPDDLDTPIIITGAGFAAELSGTQVITAPTVRLGEVALSDVNWVSTSTLTATVAWGMAPGVYTLTVGNPDGQSASLPGAFTVTQGIGVWTTEGPYGGAVTTLLVNPAAPATLYASVQAPSSASGIGLFRSVDGGLNWELILAGAGNQPHSVDLSPPEPSVIYAGKPGVGPYRSDDGGDNWTTIPIPGVGGGEVRPYAHPTDAQVVYAAVTCVAQCGGVYRSEDQGGHWVDRASGITDTQVTALAFDTADPQIMYAGTGNGHVFRSTTEGETWNWLGRPDQFISHLAVNPFGGHEVWATGADGSGHGGYLWKYSGGGWTQVQPGVGAQNQATSLVFSPVVSGTMWMGAIQGSFRSTDGGAVWETLGAPLSGVNCLAVDPANAQKIYLGYNGTGVYQTADGGDSWAASNEGLAGVYPTGLAVHPDDPATVYAVAHGTGTFKTNNGGGSWLAVHPDDQVPRAPLVDPLDPQRVYIGSTNGVCISEDEGQNWSCVRPIEPPPQYLACCGVEVLSLLAARQPGQLIMGVGFLDKAASAFTFAGGGIYTSTDFGQTWGHVDVGQVISPVAVLASDPNDPAVFYAGTGRCCDGKGSGLWKSEDGGASWSLAGLPGQQITGIAVDPFDSQRVFAASLNLFYASTDGGAAWALGATQDAGLDKLLAVPTTPATLYQYGWGGLLRSSDAGLHWGRAAGPLGYARIGSAAAATMDDRLILYMGTAGGSTAGLTSGAPGRGLAASAETLINAGVYRNTVQQLALYLPLIRR